MDLFNVAGQRVKHVAGGWFEAGDHAVSVGTTGGSGATLGVGVYFVRLRVGEVTLGGKVIVSH
jgi:hypothetical protein